MESTPNNKVGCNSVTVDKGAVIKAVIADMTSRGTVVGHTKVDAEGVDTEISTGT